MDARGHIRCDIFTHTHLCQQTNGLEPCGRTYAQCGRPYARGIFPCEDPGEVARAADEMLDLTGGGGGGKSAQTARSKEAARSLAVTYRASAAPGVVHVGSLVFVAPPTYRRATFSDFQFTAAIIYAMALPAIVRETAHPTLNEWKVKCLAPKPACSKCCLKRAAMAFAERGLARRFGIRSPDADIFGKRYPVDISHPHESAACA